MNREILSDHQLLALWAANCAERVIVVFWNAVPDDERPRKAIDAAKQWVRGEIAMLDARKAAFAAHAAARDTDNEQARFVARAAGHAAATAHVADHAQHAAAYARKAVTDVEVELAWQYAHLPSHLRSTVFPAARSG